jgi:hypothetical protein
MAALQQLLDALRAARASREVSSILLLIGKAVESLLEGLVHGLQVRAATIKLESLNKYLVAIATLFGYLFFNSYTGTVLRLMRSRFTYNVSHEFCLWFYRLDVGF